MRMQRLLVGLSIAALAGSAIADDAGFVVESFAPVARTPIATDQAIGAEHRDRDDAIVHGRLRSAMIRSTGDALPVGTAFAAFGDALGIRVTLAFAPERIEGESPLDRPMRIERIADSVRAIDLLVELVESAFGADGGWQVLGGRLEVGPKEFLARSESRRREVFEFQLLHDRHPGVADEPADMSKARETQDLRAARMISYLTSLEPNAFEVDGAVHTRLVQTDEITNPLSRTGRYASISWRQGTMVVTAPEYVLHLIRGPRGIEPPDLPGASTAGADPDAADPDAAEDWTHRDPGNSALRGERGVPSVTLRRYEPRQAMNRSRGSRYGPEGAFGGLRGDDPALIALGRLWHSRLRVSFDGVSVRDAVAALETAVETPIRAFWLDDARRAFAGEGIDPDALVTLLSDEIGGLEALEMILSLATGSAPATWQLHLGSVEIGPRTVLARRGARRTVTYDTADLLLEPPYFVPPRRVQVFDPHPSNNRWRDVVTPLEERWGEELGFDRRNWMRTFDPTTRIGEFGGDEETFRRKSRDFLTAEMLLDIERHIESEAWLPSDDAPPDRRTVLEREVLGRQGIWATARSRAGTIIITAPDFVHRGIGGYPPLPSPAN